MQRVGVLGSAAVGKTLAAGFAKHGYEARIGSHDPAKLKEFAATSGITAGTFADVAAWGDALVLEVKGSVAEDARKQAGAANLRGRIVMDTTNLNRRS